MHLCWTSLWATGHWQKEIVKTSPSLGRVDERTLIANCEGWWGPDNNITLPLFLMNLRAYWLLQLHPNLVAWTWRLPNKLWTKHMYMQRWNSIFSSSTKQEMSVCPALICSLDTACLQILCPTEKGFTQRYREIEVCAAERKKSISLGLNEAAVCLSTSLWVTESDRDRLRTEKEEGMGRISAAVQPWQIDGCTSSVGGSFGLWTGNQCCAVLCLVYTGGGDRMRQLTSHPADLETKHCLGIETHKGSKGSYAYARTLKNFSAANNWVWRVTPSAFFKTCWYAFLKNVL